VTIIEYASLTDGQCASFSERTFPELQKRYIDTGKVRFIFREFPLDPIATAGFMLARLRRQGQVHAGCANPICATTGKFEANTYMLNVSGHQTKKLPKETTASYAQRRQAELELAMKEEAARRAAVIKNMHRLRELRLSRDRKVPASASRAETRRPQRQVGKR
jgi:hypothetical protein